MVLRWFFGQTELEEDFVLDKVDEQDETAEVLCAWCLAKAGITPSSADSHGICADCEAEVWQRYQQRRGR